jgi:hypothetical protein
LLFLLDEKSGAVIGVGFKLHSGQEYRVFLLQASGALAGTTFAE